MKLASIKTVRCAIYTRVSTEHGLDQEFNSLDASGTPVDCSKIAVPDNEKSHDPAQKYFS